MPASHPGEGAGTDQQPAPAPLCFSREQRLVKAADFSSVFKRNQRVHGRFFTMLGRRSAKHPARLGLAIARKTSGNAVVRNRIKRLVRERFRLSQHRLNPMDVIVMAKPGVARQSNRQLAEELDQLFAEVSRKCAA